MCQTCERYRNTELRDFVQSVHEKEVPTKEKPAPADSAVASGTDRSKEHEYGQDKEHKHSLWKEIQKFFRVPDDPDLDPDDSVDPDDPDDEALRENIMELFCDARSQGKTIPQEEWKRLGIGYGPVGGQQFPEACSMELMKLGPQGEPIERCIACLCGECQTHDSEFRYSEDQPREPNGEFGSGGASNESKEEHIASVVKDQVKKMVGDKDPAIINGGNCIVFAKAMEKQIPDANRVGIPNVALYGDSREHTIAGATPGSPRITVSIDKPVNAKDMPKRISSYLHQWVQVNGKNYDSETPNGVKNWRDLPFFKKGGPGRENLDNAAKHMTRSLDALQEERGLGDSLAVGGGDSQKLGAADQFKAGQLRYSPDQPRDPDGKFGSGGGGSPKDQKIGDKVKDVFGNEGTVKGWHGQSGTVQVDVAGKLQYWHPSQLQRGLYVHCGPQGEILFAPAEVRFNPDQSRVPDGKFASGGSGGRVR